MPLWHEQWLLKCFTPPAPHYYSVTGGEFALLLRDEARDRDFGEAGTMGQASGIIMDVEAGDELGDWGVAGVVVRLRLDPVRGNTCVGYTSVTSSMPSSTYMTSCIVSW
jgi:hypothetical protein